MLLWMGLLWLMALSSEAKRSLTYLEAVEKSLRGSGKAQGSFGASFEAVATSGSYAEYAVDEDNAFAEQDGLFPSEASLETAVANLEANKGIAHDDTSKVNAALEPSFDPPPIAEESFNGNGGSNGNGNGNMDLSLYLASTGRGFLAPPTSCSGCSVHENETHAGIKQQQAAARAPLEPLRSAGDSLGGVSADAYAWVYHHNVFR